METLEIPSKCDSSSVLYLSAEPSLSLSSIRARLTVRAAQVPLETIRLSLFDSSDERLMMCFRSAIVDHNRLIFNYKDTKNNLI